MTPAEASDCYWGRVLAVLAALALWVTLARAWCEPGWPALREETTQDGR